MSDTRKHIPRVEALINQVDSDAIVESTFYDDVSDRLFITVVKGPKEIRITFLGHEFSNGDAEVLKRKIQSGMSHLDDQPPS